MEKRFGKNKEFKLLNTFSEKKKTYVRYFYECECLKCGSKRTLSQSDANTGICTVCRTKKTINKLIGKKINIYKVLSFSHRNEHNLDFYVCKCLKCKMKSTVSVALIKTNDNCRFCRKRGREATEDAQFNYKIDQYKRGAKERNLAFSLTNDEFKKIIIDKCFYCNDTPKEKKYCNSKNKDKTISWNGIDRIDSNIGYTSENVVTCCEMCNRMKMAYDKDSFLIQIEKIYNNTIKK